MAGMTTSETPKKAPVKPKDILSVNLFLLDKEQETMPSKDQETELFRYGLEHVEQYSPPKSERPGPMDLTGRKTEIPLSLSALQLRKMIISLYPDFDLDKNKFKYGIQNKKNIDVIKPNSAFHLKQLKGSKSKLFLMPKQKIEIPSRSAPKADIRKTPSPSPTMGQGDMKQTVELNIHMGTNPDQHREPSIDVKKFKRQIIDLTKTIECGGFGGSGSGVDGAHEPPFNRYAGGSSWSSTPTPPKVLKQKKPPATPPSQTLTFGSKQPSGGMQGDDPPRETRFRT